MTNNQSSIKHYNGKKSITINAYIEQSKNTAIRSASAMQDYFDSIAKEYSYVSVEFAGEVKETI